MARPSKDAVVFLIDSSPSMNVAYPCNSTTSTRLSAAKTALAGMLSNLMIQSKTHEVCVIVLKTKTTEHHLDHEDFPNMTMLGSHSVVRPTVELLREVSKVESTIQEDEIRETRGDVCDGIILAADALLKRTIGKEYNRKIVIFTDATHALVIDQEQILRVIDSLREMECHLVVIGLDFTESAEFEHALQGKENRIDDDTSNVQATYSSGDDSTSETGSESVNSNEGSENLEDEPSPEDIKRETEKFLVGVARLTGGSVQAATTMQSLLDSTFGKRIPKSSRRKVSLHIAPGIVLECRCSLLLSRANLPSLKKEAICLDEEERPIKNTLGELMTSEIKVSTVHFDPDNPDIGLSEDSRTKAFRFGDDVVPIGTFDLDALMHHSPVCIKVLGYAEQSQIPLSLMMGPPHGISGGDSRRAQVGIASLAQAMHELNFAAMCTFVKTKDSDPILAALFPWIEAGPNPSRLFLIQVPFAGDVQRIAAVPLDNFFDKEMMQVCDDLIDAMMLPTGTLESTLIANPSLRAFRRTLVSKAIDPESSVISARFGSPDDPMSTPVNILDKANPFWNKFSDAFPLEKISADERKGETRGKGKYWDNFDEDVLAPGKYA